MSSLGQHLRSRVSAVHTDCGRCSKSSQGCDCKWCVRAGECPSVELIMEVVRLVLSNHLQHQNRVYRHSWWGWWRLSHLKMCLAGEKGAGRRPEKVPLLAREREQLRCEGLWFNRRQIKQGMLCHDIELRDEAGRNGADEEPKRRLFPCLPFRSHRTNIFWQRSAGLWERCV